MFDGLLSLLSGQANNKKDVYKKKQPQQQGLSVQSAQTPQNLTVGSARQVNLAPRVLDAQTKQPAKLQQLPQQPQFDLVRGLQALAKAPEQFAGGVGNTLKAIGQAPGQALVRTTNQISGRQEYTPQGAINKLLLGDESIKGGFADYTKQTANDLGALTGNKGIGDNIPSYAAAPLGLLLTASDLTPLGGGKKQGLKQVAKAVEQDASKASRIERGLKTNIQSKEKTTPALNVMLDQSKKLSYAKRRDTDELQIKAANLANEDEDAALAMVRNSADDKAVATGLELVKKYQNSGDFEKAIDVIETLAPKLTEAGRTAQAASIYGRLTPAGSLRFTQRQLDRYNEANRLIGDRKARLSPEKTKQITDLSNQIQKLPDGDQKTKLIGELTQVMNSAAPTPTLEKLANIWRAGLLTSARTLEGGVLGNATKAALDAPSQAVAAGLDKFITAPLLNNGVRSNVFTLKGGGQGFKEGLGRGKEYLKTGIDPRDVGSGYDLKTPNYTDGNKVLNALGKGSDYVYRAMGAVDNPFYYSALGRSNREEALLEASKRGLKGQEKNDFVNQFSKSLDGNRTERATDKAKEAVFQNETALGTVAAAFKNSASKIKNPQARAATQAVLDFTVPFVKIPSAVATALVDYSPAGPLVQIARQGFARTLDIEKLNKSIGKGVTGTIGGVWLGTQLYNNGLLTLDEPADPAEKQLWQLEGKQPFSIKVGGEWRKLNYVQPFGSLLAVGGGYERAKAQGAQDPLLNAAASGLKSVSDQSFLVGVNNLFDAIDDPARAAGNYGNSLAGSLIPNVVKDVARSTDSVERETNSPIDALRNGIPGLRQQNLPQRDPFGNEVATKQSPLGVLFDPFKSTKDKSGQDPVTSEIRRMYNIDPTDLAYRATPSPLTKDQTFAGQKAVLTPEQLNDFKKTVGEPTYDTIKSTIKSDNYQRLSDTDKAKAISNITEATRANNKEDFAKVNTLKDKLGNTLSFGLSDFKKRNTETKALQKGEGSTTTSSASSSTKATTTSRKSLDGLTTKQRETAFNQRPDAEYKYEKRKFEQDKRDGKLDTTAKRIRAEQSLAKAEVGSKYTKETRDLYSLSKSQLNTALNQSKNPDKLRNDIIAYGDALVDAGLTSKNKFRDTKGNVSTATKAKSSGGTKRSSGGTASTRRASGTNVTAAQKKELTRSNTARINTVASLSNKIKSVKVSKRSLNSKINKKGLAAFKKASTSKVNVKRNNLS